MADTTRQPYIAFFEEYFNYMDDLNPEQYFQFMTLIRNLRWKGIDTLPEDVTDKDVRLAWRSIRPSIAKSRRNHGDLENRRSNNDLQPNEDFDNKPVEPTNTPEPIKESAPTPKAPETVPNEPKIPCTIPSSEGYSQQNEEIYIETLFKTIWQERSGELSNIYVQLQGNDDWTTYYHRLKSIMGSYNLQKDVERQVLNKIEAYLKDNYNEQIRTQATA